MQRLVVLAALATLTVATSACGSGDSSDDTTGTTDRTDETTETTEDPGAEEVAFDDWADEVNAACVDLGDALGTAEPPDSSDLELFAAFLEEGAAAFGAFVEALDAAGTPDESAEDAMALVELAKEEQGLLAEAADTAVDDPATTAELMEEGSELNDDMTAIAEDLGLDGCISMTGGAGDTPESDGTATYDRQETIDNLVADSGLTEEQAVCVVDVLEASVGTEALNEAVDTDDATDLSPEIEDALTDAVSECVFTE